MDVATSPSKRIVRSMEDGLESPAEIGETRMSVAPNENSSLNLSATRASSPHSTTASIMESLHFPSDASWKPASISMRW